MEPKHLTQTGKRYMTMLTAGIIVLSLTLTAYEVVYWQNSILLATQILLAILLAVLALLTLKGSKTQWVLFGALAVAGLLAFYMGGSRMADFSKGKISVMSYLTAGAGLIYLGCAIYLIWSIEIKAYLGLKAQERKQRKQQKETGS